VRGRDFDFANNIERFVTAETAREGASGMPATTGRYAARTTHTLADRVNHRWFWLRHTLCHTATRILRQGRLDPRDSGGGYTLHREWGRWTLRPVTGWRSLRWITPAPHVTRTIPGHDRDAACDWGLNVLGIDRTG
jgi:hypothetical protein